MNNAQDKSKGPSKPDLPAPTNPQKKATPQMNDDLASNAIFGPEMSLMPKEPEQRFSANFARL
ncbi:unnamed protein product [Acanthoscelides obtectus]|uniref:Uncharacterized protein n=1 Tax=Acanthoscelides obtectus TaxID=200917 RepID=A0A9P0KK74_ACAOB|nr:unnamed protein product [Acanthoscelides obtectus]CAK1685094.1 hypothetical protein AOBTE_LOCUS35228 [Acanthoscelides obtectus]